jgi:predicted small secreted protein
MMQKSLLQIMACVICSMVLSGCATFFGWDIHAPALLSQRFYERVEPAPQRLALYLDPSLFKLISQNKGGRFADPQTYHIGEAYIPIVIEGFQRGFSEFILIEEEPTRQVLAQYAIPYLVYVRPKGFENDVSLKGQGVAFATETLVFDTNLTLLDRVLSSGKSDSKKVFAKKGGPQVNFNAALENNVESTVLYLQDAIRTQRWQEVKT